MTNQSRVAAGVPTGGEFAAHDRADDTVSLLDSLRTSQRAEWELARHNERLSTKILAQTLLAERPDARYFHISEGEEGGYWNSEGTLLDDQEQELCNSFDLECGDDVFGLMDLPLRMPTAWGEETPAPGFEWLTMTPGNNHDYATATIDLRAAAAQDIS